MLSASAEVIISTQPPWPETWVTLASLLLTPCHIQSGLVLSCWPQQQENPSLSSTLHFHSPGLGAHHFLHFSLDHHESLQAFAPSSHIGVVIILKVYLLKNSHGSQFLKSPYLSLCFCSLKPLCFNFMKVLTFTKTYPGIILNNFSYLHRMPLVHECSYLQPRDHMSPPWWRISQHHQEL